MMNQQCSGSTGAAAGWIRIRIRGLSSWLGLRTSCPLVWWNIEMTSKAAPEPEEWVSVTRESEDGGLAKRDMQDVTLNDDVEAAPAPSTTTTPSGGGAELSDAKAAAAASAASAASDATTEAVPPAATTVPASLRVWIAAVDRCGALWRSPVARVRAVWRATLLLSCFVAVSALVAAAHNDTDVGGRKSAGFAAIWSTFLVLTIGYSGARVLDNSWNSDLARGMFFGAVAMMSQTTLCLFAVFIGLAQEKPGADRTDRADHALAALLFLLSLCYGVLASLLGADFRKAITGRETTAAAATGAGAPAPTPEAPADRTATGIQVESPLASPSP